ncbi:MAG: hypothetical protein MK171_10705 [Pirellulales bacterium]|nr:hypothetical protein [Pirellulales bacterium]
MPKKRSTPNPRFYRVERVRQVKHPRGGASTGGVDRCEAEILGDPTSHGTTHATATGCRTVRQLGAWGGPKIDAGKGKPDHTSAWQRKGGRQAAGVFSINYRVFGAN